MPSERTVAVRLKGDISDYSRAMLAASAGTKAFVKELDTSNDRMSNLVQTSLAIGPALVPIGAAAVPAVAGLANQLSIAAAAGGVAILAFLGVGDALKATNDYAIEPTAANFDKMQQSLVELGPAGREFVGFLQEIRPQLQGLQDAAQAGLFPGAEAGIRDLLTVLPQAERIVGNLADGLGTLLAEAGDNLTDPRWVEFFTYIETSGRQTLLDFGRTIGNLTEGFANLWVAFDPLTDDFSAGFLQMSRDFATWTDGLSQTQGFQEFVDYIQTNGPQAWDTLGALGNALLELVEAAAPVGSAALPIIEALADAFSAVADSPVGPVLIGAAAGISAFSRAVALFNTAQGSAITGMLGKTALGGAARATKDLPAASRAYLDFGAALDTAGPKVGKYATTADRLGASMRGLGKIAAPTAAFGLLATGLDEKLNLTNTATLALAGSLVGPWGTAVGAGVGLAKDFADSQTTMGESIEALNQKVASGALPLEQQKKAIDDTRAAIEAFEAAGFDQGDERQALAETEQQYGKNARAAQDLKFAEAGLGDSMDDASDSVRNQTDALLDNIAKHNQLADVLLGRRGSMRDFEAAIDDASASIKENGKTLDVGTEKGRANQQALDDIAGAYNNLDEASKGNVSIQNRARSEFVQTGIRMGLARTEAEHLADAMLDIPSNVGTTVTVKDLASPKIGGITGALAGIDGKTATVYIHAVKTGASIGAISGAIERADGGIISRAAGGYVTGPGTTTSDSIPALLSDQEYVVRASSVAKYGVRFMDDVNAGRFASGGLAGATRATVPDRGTPSGPLAFSLVGAQVAIDPRTNVATFVRGEIRAAIDSQGRYDSSSSIQDRRPRR